MPDDVQVKFGGDASGIKAAAEQAKAAVQQQAQVARTANSTAAAAFAALTTEIRETRLAQEEALRVARESAAAARETADALGSLRTGVMASAAAWVAYQAAARGAAYATNLYSSAWGDIKTAQVAVVGAYQGLQSIKAAADEAATSVRDYAASWGYVAQFSSMADVESRILGSTIPTALGRVAEGYRRAAADGEVAGSRISDVAARSIAAAGNMDTLKKAASDAGFANVTGYLDSLIVELTRIPGVTKETAAGIVGTFGSISDVSEKTVGLLVSLTRGLSVSAEEANKYATTLANVFADPAGNGAAYLNSLGSVDTALKAQFETAKRGMDQQKMQVPILQATIDRVKNLAEERVRRNKEEMTAYDQMTLADRLFNAGYLLNLQNRLSQDQAFLDLMNRQIDGWNRQATAIGNATEAAGKLSDTLRGMTSGGLTAQIEAQTAALGKLRQGLSGSTDAADMIRRFEGYRSDAYKDSDGAYRVGYGSDTTTAPGGQVFPVTSSTKTTQDAAERDLTRRVDEFTERARENIGTAFESLSAQAKASIVSLTYNYGHVPERVVAASQSGNETAIAEAILSLRKAPGSVNYDRRSLEAQNIVAGPAAEQYRATSDQRQANIDRQTGGSALDFANAANANRNATSARNDVKDQEAIVAALEKQLEQTQALDARTRVLTQLDQARATLTDKRTAQIKADADLQTAGMEASSKESLRIKNAALEKERDLYERGTTQRMRIEAQMQANTKATDDAIAQEKEAIENQAFARAKARIEEQMAEARAQNRDHVTTAQEQLAIRQQLNAQLEALELGHNARIQAIREGDTARIRQLAADRVQIEANASQRRLKAEIDARRAEFQETAGTYRQIGSTLTSNVFSVIQGQASIKQAAANTAMSLIQSYAQAKVRMIADMLAGVAVHQGTEVAKTGTTATAVATRTGIEASGAAASQGLQATDALTSIATSAAKSFAGIFSFLSPFLGPAAAGPAAAGQATVLAASTAVASHAIGSWSLPNDMLSVVHQGEMIVPKSQTPWVQDMIRNRGAGSDSSGGGGGGITNNFQVQAIDAAGVARFLKQYAPQITGTVSGQMNANPSKRPGF